MYISVDESQMGVFFLDCFRFCMNDIEYDIILNKPDLDTYEYEIWKRTNREMNLKNTIMGMKERQIIG